MKMATAAAMQAAVSVPLFVLAAADEGVDFGEVGWAGEAVEMLAWRLIYKPDRIDLRCFPVLVGLAPPGVIIGLVSSSAKDDVGWG